MTKDILHNIYETNIHNYTNKSDKLKRWLKWMIFIRLIVFSLIIYFLIVTIKNHFLLHHFLFFIFFTIVFIIIVKKSLKINSQIIFLLRKNKIVVFCPFDTVTTILTIIVKTT